MRAALIARVLPFLAVAEPARLDLALRMMLVILMAGSAGLIGANFARQINITLVLRSVAKRSVSKDGNAKDGAASTMRAPASRLLPPFETLRFAPFLRVRQVCSHN
jgi:hypothetical protein